MLWLEMGLGRTETVGGRRRVRRGEDVAHLLIWSSCTDQLFSAWPLCSVWTNEGWPSWPHPVIIPHSDLQFYVTTHCNVIPNTLEHVCIVVFEKIEGRKKNLINWLGFLQFFLGDVIQLKSGTASVYDHWLSLLCRFKCNRSKSLTFLNRWP